VTLADLQLGVRDGVVHAVLSGEIDMSNADHLGRAIMQGTPSETTGAVLDLSDVGYLDSAGIHLLYRLRESLRVRGQRLCVVIPEQSVINDALRLAGIPGHIEVFPDAAAALKAVRDDARPAG
jgi:anti-anti-sigma factor